MLLNHGERGADAGAVAVESPGTLARVRLARELFHGRFLAGESVKASEMDEHSVLKVVREFQTLGMIALSRDVSAVFHSPNPKEMQEAYANWMP